MPAPDIGHDAPRQPHSRGRRPWWKRLMRAMGMGGAPDYRRHEPFRPDVAIQLAEAAHRREQERRQGLQQHRTQGSGTAAD